MAARAKAVLALALVALASKNNGAAAEEEHPLAKLFAAMPEGAQVHIHHYVPPNAGDEMPDEGVKGEVAGLKPDETPENAQNELALQIADPMVGGGVAEGRRRSLLLAKAGRGSKGRRRSLLDEAATNPFAALFGAIPDSVDPSNIHVHIHNNMPREFASEDTRPDAGVKGEVAGLKPGETPTEAQNELALQIADPMVDGGVAEGRRRSLLLAKAGRGSKGRRRSLLMDADETSEGGTYMDAAADAAENAMGAMKDAAEDTMDAVAEMVGAALAPGPEAELAGTRSSITLDPATLSRPELRYGNYLPQIVARQS